LVNWIINNGTILLGVFTMKILEKIYEWVIIVFAIFILVIPEMAYSCVLRGIDWVEDCISEL